ncbi:MAG: hypothetical protein ABW217_03825 [Polyangiaceae bacterium]
MTAQQWREQARLAMALYRQAHPADPQRLVYLRRAEEYEATAKQVEADQQQRPA